MNKVTCNLSLLYLVKLPQLSELHLLCIYPMCGQLNNVYNPSIINNLINRKFLKKTLPPTI